MQRPYKLPYYTKNHLYSQRSKCQDTHLLIRKELNTCEQEDTLSPNCAQYILIWYLNVLDSFIKIPTEDTRIKDVCSKSVSGSDNDLSWR